MSSLEKNGDPCSKEDIESLKKAILFFGDFEIKFVVHSFNITQDPRAAKGIAESERRRRDERQ